MKNTLKEPVQKLRQRAERTLLTDVMSSKTEDPDDVLKLVHELQVHQIELEMQNEELQNKQSELLSTLAKMDAIFRTVSDAIIMIDSNGRLAHFNEAAEEICGYNSSLLGKDISEIGLGFSSVFCTILLETLATNAPRVIDRFERRTANGKMHSFSLRTTPVTEADGTVSGAVAVIRDETRLVDLERTLHIRGQFHGIVGASASMQRVYSLIEALADVPTTVLINGESGTGKELVAAALQACGKRFKGPFVKVNCSALSEPLLESELFGHVRGAFTGAIADKVGRFKKADGGTLLLDEVGDISPAVQMRLLRVLQESEFERVGDSTPIKVSVRIIAATNKNLEEKVRLGLFRQDLYYRLNVICIELPPLRDRRDDLNLLVAHFITHFNDKFDRKIQGVTDNVMDLFRAHDWPGNIRELEHVIERAVILCTSNTISANDLPNAVVHDFGRTVIVASKTTSPSKCTVQSRTVEDTMVLTNGNKAHAARLLGISRPTLYKLLQKGTNL